MVRKIWAWLLLFVLCIAIQMHSYAQYFSKVYDFDSSSDWGKAIFLNQDSSYFVIGLGLKNTQGLRSINITKDGSTIVAKASTIQNNSSYYPGNTGRVKRLADSSYLVPLIVVWPKSQGYFYEAGGMAVLNKNGDTIFTRLYTDTAHYKEKINDCAPIRNGYVLAGMEINCEPT